MLASIQSFSRRRTPAVEAGTKPLLSVDLGASDMPGDSSNPPSPPSYNEAVNFTVEPLSVQATFAELSDTSKALKPLNSSQHITLENSSSYDDEAVVTVYKQTKGSRLGLTLRSDNYGRAFVYSVDEGSPAEHAFKPFDEIVEVDRVRLLTEQPAELAVKLLKAAPAGYVMMRKRPRSEIELRAAQLLQDRWRMTRALSQLHVQRKVILKSHELVRLGLSLSPDFHSHSVVLLTKPNSHAERVLNKGDLIIRINGEICSAPAETARKLRESSGQVDLEIVPYNRVDYGAIRRAERTTFE